MSQRNVVSVDLTAQAKRDLEEIVDSFEIKQVAALGRILQWFTRQDRAVQALVLGQIPDDIAGDVIDLMYRRRHEETVPLEGPDSAENVVDDVERSLEDEQQGDARTPPKTRRKRA